jgi:hypothetical protein
MGAQVGQVLTIREVAAAAAITKGQITIRNKQPVNK